MEELLAARPSFAPFLASRRRPATTTPPTSWLKDLKDDKQSILTPASHAQKADDYLHALQPQAAAPTEAEDSREAPRQSVLADKKPLCSRFAPAVPCHVPPGEPGKT
jgi:hypothetical protein